MKKIIIVLIVILITIIIVITAILNAFKTKSNTSITTKTLPTSYPNSGGSNIKRSDIEQKSLQTLQNLTSYQSSDFDINFDKNLNKFIVNKKTDQADEKLGVWLQNNNLQSLQTDPNLAIITNPLKKVKDKTGKNENQMYLQFLRQNNNTNYIPRLPAEPGEAAREAAGNGGQATSSELTQLTDLLKILLDMNQNQSNLQLENIATISSSLGLPSVSTAKNDPTVQIQSSCQNGQITASNTECLNSITPPISPEIAKQIMQYSAQTYGYLQCVGYVQGMVLMNTGKVLDNGGNAIDFATNIPTGYKFISNSQSIAAKPGDLPIWNSGSSGHIAYITEVYDTSNVRISEANYNLSGAIGERNISLSDKNLLGWLTSI